MAERLIKLYLPASEAADPKDLFPEETLLSTWEQQAGQGTTEFTFLVESGEAGEVLDRLESRYGHVDGFRVVILSVAASLPRTEEDEEEEEEGDDGRSSEAISRAELLEAVGKGARFSTSFIVLVILATVVSVIGMLRDDVMTLIAAIVMAPLLGPNVALG